MSLWARPQPIDLAQTPYLCWRWRVSHALKSADIGKAGDDYAARVYVAFSLPKDSLSWGTRTKLALARKIYGDTIARRRAQLRLGQPPARRPQRPNAYTAQTQMVVQRSDAALSRPLGAQCRDLRADAAAKWLPPAPNPRCWPWRPTPTTPASR